MDAKLRSCLVGRLLSILTLTFVWSLSFADTDNIGTKTYPLTAGTSVPAGEFEAVGSIGGCTATLISTQTVLTAAHCVCADSSTSDCVSRKTFKMVDVFPANSSSVRQDIALEGTVHVYPEFGKAGWLRKDFALIILDRPVYEVAKVEPMGIAYPANAPTVGQDLTLVGFGPTGTDCSKNRGKQKMTLAVSKVGLDGINFNHKGLHACPGDSGGPAVDDNGLVTGVASWSNFKDSSTYRPVYENAEWIASMREKTGWQKFFRPASDFLVAFDSIENIYSVFGVSESDGNVYSRSRPSADWVKIGGPGKAFVLSHGSSLVGLAPDGGAVFMYDGVPGKWTQIGGPAAALYGGRTGLYATNPETGDIWRYTGTPRKWERIGGPGKMFASDNQTVYGLSPDGQGVYRYDGTSGKWTQVGGPASAIYGGSAGLFATSPTSGDLYQYGGKPNEWQRIGGPGKAFAVGANPVGLSPDQKGVYVLAGPEKWQKVGGTADRIFVGGSLVCARNPKSHEVYCLDPMRVAW